MYNTKFFRVAALAVIAVAAVQAAAGQEEVRFDPSFDVELRLVIGSNGPAIRGEVPADMAGMVRHLRTVTPFSNYRLASTFIGRVNNGGTFESSSISNFFGDEGEQRLQTFLDWALINFRRLQPSAGPAVYNAQGFKLNMRIPVVTGYAGKDDAGKPISATTFERIALNISKVVVQPDRPTLVGTLSLPGSSGTMFVIMKVRSGDAQAD